MPENKADHLIGSWLTFEVKLPGQGLGMKDKLAALAPPVGGGERHFAAELIGFMGLAE